MKPVLWVFIGGGAGSVIRYLLSKALNGGTFPYGTLLANIGASLLLGFVLAKVSSSSDYLRFLVAVGFCGGFSTFSTFSNESFQLFESANYGGAILHMFANLALCLAAIGLGYYMGK